MKQVNSPSDFPAEDYFLVVVFKETRVHHPGDERSRTHPGHGYPEHTEIIPSCEMYISETAYEVNRNSKAELDDVKQFVHKLTHPAYGQTAVAYKVLRVERTLVTKTSVIVEGIE